MGVPSVAVSRPMDPWVFIGDKRLYFSFLDWFAGLDKKRHLLGSCVCIARNGVANMRRSRRSLSPFASSWNLRCARNDFGAKNSFATIMEAASGDGEYFHEEQSLTALWASCWDEYAIEHAKQAKQICFCCCCLYSTNCKAQTNVSTTWALWREPMVPRHFGWRGSWW